MIQERYKLIGHGVYGLSQAERLTGIPVLRIKRWSRGYHYTYRGERRFSPPAITPTHEPLGESLILAFADLVEVKLLDWFLRHGVRWKTIRIAAERAKELLGEDHPFSSGSFKTDGRTILAEMASMTGDKVLLELVQNQYEFDKIVAQFLYGGLDFNEFQNPERWWPMGKSRRVVIDPKRAFGSPIVVPGNIQTLVLAQAVVAEESIDAVAWWYEVDRESVVDAVDYENSLSRQVLSR